MSEGPPLLPDAIAAGPFLQKCRSLTTPQLAGQEAPAFLITLTAVGSTPRPLQRTLTFDGPEPITGESAIFVLPLRPKIAGKTMLSLGRAVNSDLVVVDTTISKLHAYFRVNADGSAQLWDGGSRNGTLVDNVRVAVRGEGEPTLLRGRTSVRFGSIALVYVSAAELRSFLEPICT